jgi:hypothetical protein
LDQLVEEGLIEGVANDFVIVTGTDVSGDTYVELTMYNLDTLKVRSSVYKIDIY